MKITWVPSAVGGSEQLQYCTSAIINDAVAIDAGTIGFYKTPNDQAQIKHVLLTHTHIDHVASLPIFVENAYEPIPGCVTIHGSESVLKCCQDDLFNDRLWPDFIKLSEGNDNPFVKLARFDPGQTLELEGLRITSVALNHVVPTSGYIVEDDSAAFAFVTDTGPTEQIWKVAAQTKNLKAVFLDVAFPNNMAWLANASKHHTPSSFAEEIKKLAVPVRWIAIHVKPRFHREVLTELRALNLTNVELIQFDQPYDF